MNPKKYALAICIFLMLICVQYVQSVPSQELPSQDINGTINLHTLNDSKRYFCGYPDSSSCDLNYAALSYNVDLSRYDFPYDSFKMYVTGDDYVKIENKMISDAKVDNIYLKLGVLIRAPSSGYTYVSTHNIISNGIIKSKDYILVNSVYVPKVGEYAEFNFNPVVLDNTYDMDRGLYMIYSFFVMPPFCFRRDDGFRAPNKNDVFDIQKDISGLINYIKTADDFVLDKANDISARNSVATVIAAQSYEFNTYINCLHNDDTKRKALVNAIPSKLYFYMIAASYLNTGVRTDVWDDSYTVAKSQPFPSTQKLILDAYVNTAKDHDVLEDAYKYKDLPIFMDFVNSLATKGELNQLLSKTKDASIQGYYISVLVNATQKYYVNPNIATEYTNMLATDMQNRVALKELNKIIMNNKFYGLTKGIILNSLVDKTPTGVGPYMEFFLFANKNYFDKADFDKAGLESFKNLYDVSASDLYGFDTKVLSVYAESQYIPVYKMIKYDEKSGKYYLNGSMFFGSVTHNDQMWDYDNFINYTVSDERASDERFKSELVPDPNYDEAVEYYKNTYIEPGHIKFNPRRTATRLTRTQDITFKDKDGKTVTRSVTIVLMLYFRGALLGDPLTPLIFTRGHIGNSARSAYNLLYSNRNVEKDMPIIIHLSGCSESGSAQNIIDEFSDRQIIISATSGTGTQDVNDPWIFAIIDCLVKGKDSVDTQSKCVRDILEQKKISSNPNYEYYMDASEFVYDKLAMPKSEVSKVKISRSDSTPSFWSRLSGYIGNLRWGGMW